jgi:hypothetical protein
LESDELPHDPTVDESEAPLDVDDGADASGAYFGDRAGDERGLFGALRLGPTVAVGLPHPITYGLDATYDQWIGGAFSVGAYKGKAQDVTIKIDNWDVRLRWFPLRTSFFVGAAYGNQTLKGETSKKISGTDTTVTLDIKTTYLTPHVGWFKTWDVGFTMGFELGYQMPLSSSADLDTDTDDTAAEEAVKATDDYKDLESDAEEQGEKLGKKGLPYITLMRLGWLL